MKVGQRGKAAPQAARPTGEVRQLVSFSVGTGGYVVDIMRIKEIIQPVPIAPVPKAPVFMEGVIELRQAILPVVDVRKRFDLPATPLGRHGKYLVVTIDVGDKRMIVALIVDHVREQLRIPAERIRPTPALAQDSTRYFTGVIHHEGRILMMLDLDQLLSSTEKVSLSGLGRSAGDP